VLLWFVEAQRRVLIDYLSVVFVYVLWSIT
jgi:hypothetical protein